jgi:hypothetical protein
MRLQGIEVSGLQAGTKRGQAHVPALAGALPVHVGGANMLPAQEQGALGHAPRIPQAAVRMR